ncbi:MAG: LamG domain-containing protein [archaeon]
MGKRGISMIVATVLIILMTVAGVAIIWIGIVPMVRNGFDFQDLDGRVSILLSRGYTVYDSLKGIATVQVSQDAGESLIKWVKVSFFVDGNSVSSTVVAPGSGQTKVYAFNLSGYGVPDSVGASSIFVSAGGKEKEGSMSSKVDIPEGKIKEVYEDICNLGEDCLEEVPSGGGSGGELPTGGLISWWKFDGDAMDSWGDNHGSFFGNANAVGNVLNLDGDADYVNVTGGVMVSGVVNHTICGWVYTSDLDEMHVFSTGNGNEGYYLRVNNGFLYHCTWSGGGGVTSCTGISNNIFGGWHQFCLNIINYNSFISYIDGDYTTDGSFTQRIPSSGFKIGTNRIANGNFFNGTIDDMMVWGRVLSEEEIGDVYSAQMK